MRRAWNIVGRFGVLLLAVGVAGCDADVGTVTTMPAGEPDYANEYDRRRGPMLAAREADWRNGAIVYQVIVDRFAPPADLEAKRHLYPPPKRLRPWSESPKRGTFLPEQQVWTQEIDFWGGDLESLRGKLAYVAELGADVLYLNPIHHAYTNHKYDALDYFAVSPEYGTRDDVKALADACHERGLKLVLDGVFNHMGRQSAWFQEALADPQSPKRDWFFIDKRYKHGYRAWADVPNLPELRLENPAVRARIFGDPDSVVQGYLRDGVDGWRLDVAYDIGYAFLSELTEAAHRARPGSLVVGEIWNYPQEWSPAVDAVMNFHARGIILNLVQGHLSGPAAGRLCETMIADAGLDPMLEAWLVLDNHDVPRLKTVLPQPWQQRMAQVLQFTLPGSPNLYYGVEVGMEGKLDPEMRGPMRWDLVRDDNPDLQWMRRLIGLRRSSRALRIGDFGRLESEVLLAFQRSTDRIGELVIVVANSTAKPETEVLPVRDSKLMNFAKVRDALSDVQAQTESGLLRVTVPAHTICVFRPVMTDGGDYSPYKRVQ